MYSILDSAQPEFSHFQNPNHRERNGMIVTEKQESVTVYTVTQLNAQAKTLLESTFGNIQLEGEISGFSTAQSGHSYFTLKDASSAIDCAMFGQTASRIRNKLGNPSSADGLQVVLAGRVSLYSARGKYQFIVNDLELKKDKGALYLAYEKLKKDLENKGYFAADRKKAVPKYPKTVGIITSPSGAAVLDIIRAFKRRNPSISLLIYPVAVQGDGAAEKIAEAIQYANSRKKVDALIIARGGGSIEDLWAFNEKLVADAIFNSKIPIVTGIGHDYDHSIADFVADENLATPTAAAERLSTPSVDEMLTELQNVRLNLIDIIRRKLNDEAQSVDLAEKGLVHPKQRIESLQGDFENSLIRLQSIVNTLISRNIKQIDLQHHQLLRKSPSMKISLYQQQCSNMQNLLELQMKELCDKYNTRTESLRARLEGINPAATLERGYSIVRKVSDNSIMRRAGTITAGEKVTAQLGKGVLHCDVEAVEE